MSDDELPNFEGFAKRECGEHRTVGPHRAWCYDCSEWCYPSAPCVRCERPTLVPQASRDELREALAKALCPAPDECYGSPRGHCFRRADRVLDVLIARGLVASPETGEGRQ